MPHCTRIEVDVISPHSILHVHCIQQGFHRIQLLSDELQSQPQHQPQPQLHCSPCKEADGSMQLKTMRIKDEKKKEKMR